MRTKCWPYAILLSFALYSTSWADSIPPAPPQNLRLVADSGNRAPGAADDAYSTNAEETLNISVPGVLSNDSATDGSLSAVLLSPPSRGRLTLNPDGSFSYQPHFGFEGVDSFTYQASSGEFLSNLATVTINVVSEDEWLDTPHGYRLRQSRPRVLLTPKQLRVVIDRMYGPNAREPYKSWFINLKTVHDKYASNPYFIPNYLLTAALLYKTTGEALYKAQFEDNLPTSGMPDRHELWGWDLMWNELSDNQKRSLMTRVNNAGPSAFYEHSSLKSNLPPSDPSNGGGYYYSGRMLWGLSYAGLFAYTKFADELQEGQFNVNHYPAIVAHQLSDQGYFFRFDSRFGGDPTYNDALPGSFGGMYDCFGYDTGGGNGSAVFLYQNLKTLTGNESGLAMVRDAARGTFYQNMTYPYHGAHLQQNPRLIETYHTMVWPQSTSGERFVISSPLFASFFRDGRMQWYNNDTVLRHEIGWGGVRLWLLFYDDTLAVEPPRTNPTAMYFNGPGLATMRAHWQQDDYPDWRSDAAVALFLAGEAVSRRYEDGNSFILGRKTDVIVHAGFRSQPEDSSGHARFSRSSIATNTIQVYDPNECYDIDPRTGLTREIHSGTALADNTNFGGQQLLPDPNLPVSYWQNTLPLGIRKTSNITKFEHRPDLGYTYTVGDSAAAYTKKIDLFEREFLYLRPDVFIIFDRVNSVDPNFRKVWRINLTDQPLPTIAANASGLGVKSYVGVRSSIIDNPENITYLDSLLPKANKLVIRGGDTIIVNAKPLTANHETAGSEIEMAELDIPRILELFVSGSKTVGSLTLFGESEEGDASEVVNFTSALAMANSAKKWKRISRITTADLELDSLTISTQHYYDIESASGKLYSFPPRTNISGYNGRRRELGRWSFNLEATEPKNLDNFLNVLALKDPGVPKPQSTLLEGNSVSGVLINSFFAVFANDRGNIQGASLDFPEQGSFEGLFLNLEPKTEYFYKVTGNTVVLSQSGSDGTKVTSSAMGTLMVTVLIE